ncbi:cobaltochelatase CobT-related protein [Paraburkholderia atlantica]|uniref:cobaltochelatase CobT-related protein n=1 Tax=Paraburkholderia atlantica TaxID=2654982 RepID=UPI00187BBDC3|nr:hypothetical protein [Paraburkholderia atlantica]
MHRAKGRAAAVTLLIDRSGSMSGRKIELARLCASARCDALTQLSFDCEVLGYCPLESTPMKQLYERQRGRCGFTAAQPLRRAARSEGLQALRRDRPERHRRHRLRAREPGRRSARLGRDAPRRHPAGRRILMVFPDGYPSTSDGDPQVLRSDLRERVAAIAKRGIELVGIGVLTDAVDDFYPRNMVVSRLAELPSTVFSVLGSMLLTR